LQPILDWWKKRESTPQAWLVKRESIASADCSFDFRNPRKRRANKANVDEVIQDLERLQEPLAPRLGELKKAAKACEDLNPKKWDRIPLKNFLALVREEAVLDDSAIYKQVTVRLYGKGAVLRKESQGSEIHTRPQFIARAGQLIMSRIDARNGAFAIVPQELDAAIVSQDFPVFRVNTDLIEPEFLAILLRSHGFVEACKRASRGTTNRKRLKESVFLNEVVPLPKKAIQTSLVDFTRLLETFRTETDLLMTSADTAIPSLANYVFD
jgi:restriction endonuclease S subunit